MSVRIIDKPEWQHILNYLQGLGIHLVEGHDMQPREVAVIFANMAGYFIGLKWGAAHEIDPRDVPGLTETIEGQAQIVHTLWNKDRN